MNPEIKAQWVAALRSGEYQQGTGRLRSSKDKYCCLGVLCEMAFANDAVTRALKWDSYQYGGIGYIGFVPDEVINWAGLTVPDPIPDASTGYSLSYLNDAEEKTFSEIADLIESSDI